MKIRIIGLIICAIFFCACNTSKEDSYTLSGNIKGIEYGKLTLGYFARGNTKMLVVDSATIENGYFLMNGKLEHPNYLHGIVSPGDYSFTIFLEHSEIDIQADIKGVVADKYGNKELSVSISGSRMQAEFETLKRTKEPIQVKLKPIFDTYVKANELYVLGRNSQLEDSTLEKLQSKIDLAMEGIEFCHKQLGQVEQSYIESNPTSYLSAYLLSGQISRIPLKKGLSYYNQFSSEVQKGYYGRTIKLKLDKLKKGSLGSKATDFTTKDINGKTLSLSDFKGQYVLIDFWASSCKPCRAGNPHLIQLYQKYNDKGVEFIGISDDDSNPAAWRKAVEKDGIGIWHQGLRGLKKTKDQLKESSDILEGYAVNSLPTKILIDPNGIIIGRYCANGEDDAAMDRKFEEIFKNQ